MDFEFYAPAKMRSGRWIRFLDVAAMRMPTKKQQGPWT